MKADWLISGPSYTMFSPKAEIQKSVNCFRQKVESQQGSGAFVLMRSPGLIPRSDDQVSAGRAGFRGGFELNDNVFMIKDTVGYVFNSSFNVFTQYSPISNQNNRWVRIAHSATSILFVSDHILYRGVAGGLLLQPDTGTGDPLPFTPQDVAYIDNYFVAVDAGLGVGPAGDPQ